MSHRLSLPKPRYVPTIGYWRNLRLKITHAYNQRLRIIVLFQEKDSMARK